MKLLWANLQDSNKRTEKNALAFLEIQNNKSQILIKGLRQMTFA